MPNLLDEAGITNLVRIGSTVGGQSEREARHSDQLSSLLLPGETGDINPTLVPVGYRMLSFCLSIICVAFEEAQVRRTLAFFCRHQ